MVAWLLDGFLAHLCMARLLQAQNDALADAIAELDTNMDEIRKLLNKIHYMSDVKASAASELIIEAVEDIYSYIKY